MSSADSLRRAVAAACLALAAAGILCGAAQGAEEPRRALAVTVNPSGFEGRSDRERLDRMLERRTRRSEFMFRHICRGCGGGAVREPEGPFNPQATLGGAPPPNRVVETVTVVPVPQEGDGGPAEGR